MKKIEVALAKFDTMLKRLRYCLVALVLQSVLYHWEIFCCGLVFIVPKSLLGIARQWSRKKFGILTLKPRSHVRILLER